MFESTEAVEVLVEAVGPDGPPLWAVFDSEDGEADGFTLWHDPSRLMGWRAPATCWAVGMVSGATARSTNGSDVHTKRCQVACVVDRFGGVASMVNFGGGEVMTDVPEAGRMLDTLTRALGRPTPPPSSGPAHTLALVWLAAMAVESVALRRPLEWAEGIALHPVARLLGYDAGEDPHARGDDPVLRRTPMRPGDPIASLVIAASRAWSWAEVRARCAAAGIAVADVRPGVAAWMDDGMFSRWLEDAHQRVEILVQAGFDSLEADAHPALERLLIAACEAATATPGRQGLRAWTE